MGCLGGEQGSLCDRYRCVPVCSPHSLLTSNIDIVSLLPPEVSLQILYALVEKQSTCASNAQLQQNMHAHLACLSVSKTWRRLANDNSMWRVSFNARWGPLAAAKDALDYSSLFRQHYELDRRWTGTWWQPTQSQLSGHRDR